MDSRTLGLLDGDTIVASVEKAGRLTTFPQAFKTGEFRKEIAAMVAEGFVIPNEERITKEVLALIEQKGMRNFFFWGNSLYSDEGSDYYGNTVY